jgi:hypothetical protein
MTPGATIHGHGILGTHLTDIAILTAGITRIAVMATIGTMDMVTATMILTTMAIVQAMCYMATDRASQWGVILIPLTLTVN